VTGRRARATLGWALTALCLALPAGAAASSPIYTFDVTPRSTEAGAHPDLIVDFKIGTGETQAPVPCRDCDVAKEITVNTPAGLLGAPRDIPRCSLAEFSVGSCPIDSQVGLVGLELGGPGTQDFSTWQPLYNMAPQAGQAALLAFPAPLPGGGGGLQLPIYTSFTARTESDYGLEAKVFGIPRTYGGNVLSPYRVTQYLWGVPADPVHDVLRIPPDGYAVVFGRTSDYYGFKFPFWECRGFDPRPMLAENQFPAPQCGVTGGDNGRAISPGPTPSNAPATPFISNPTTCAGPLETSIDTLAYDHGTEHATAPYPETTGCDKLTFDPSLSAKPTTTEADSASGLDVDLKVPQSLSANKPTPSAIRDTTVQLPPGFTINPNAADGKVACTDQQARFGTREPAQCPEAAKIGTLSVTSSSLPGTFEGAMYLGEPLPGNRYRVFMVFDGFSLHVKLPGTAHPDIANGMTVAFKDLPQFTFQEFNMHVFGAERGALATPTHCGTYPVKSTFTPWASELPTQTSTQFFEIDSGPNGTPCPGAQRPFDPDFEAGVTNNTGGAHSLFIVNLSRDDGDQFLSAVNVSPPLGFSSDLRGIPYCPESAIAQLNDPIYSGLAELASSLCPANSRIGTVIGGAGAGTHVLYQGGKAYLAGPYKDAPLSLIVVIPAVTGPYDVGNIATRVAIYVDPSSARVTTVSDPLPQQIDGIPLRVRSIRVDVDRKDFALNPTNCDPLSVDATFFGDEGGQVDRSTHFQVANCAKLPYAPKLSLSLSGPHLRNGHPTLRSTFTARPGDANTASTVVSLPPTEQLDQSHLSAPCTRPQFAAGACPAASVIGHASVTSPILDQTLSGPVYLRTGNNPLPDVVIALKGPPELPLRFNLVGKVSTDSKARLTTAFDSVPDIPASQLHLRIDGGRSGLLVNNADTCKGNITALARIGAQNGRGVTHKIALYPCGKPRKHKRSRHLAHRRHPRKARRAR
jgi:hypothetical protein